MHWDDANIVLIKQYITTGQFPNNFSDSKKRKWTENYEKFSIVEDYLQYDDADFSLRVIPNQEVEVTSHD